MVGYLLQVVLLLHSVLKDNHMLHYLFIESEFITMSLSSRDVLWIKCFMRYIPIKIQHPNLVRKRPRTRPKKELGPAPCKRNPDQLAWLAGTCDPSQHGPAPMGAPSTQPIMAHTRFNPPVWCLVDCPVHGRAHMVYSSEVMVHGCLLWLIYIFCAIRGLRALPNAIKQCMASLTSFWLDLVMITARWMPIRRPRAILGSNKS